MRAIIETFNKNIDLYIINTSNNGKLLNKIKKEYKKISKNCEFKVLYLYFKNIVKYFNEEIDNEIVNNEIKIKKIVTSLDSQINSIRNLYMADINRYNKLVEDFPSKIIARILKCKIIKDIQFD